MAVERVSGTRSGAPAPIGVSAQLAAARSRPRAVVPMESWDAVPGEVGRLQEEKSLSRLAALRAVYAKIADGWTPRRGR
jgi:hypothetical protein